MVTIKLFEGKDALQFIDVASSLRRKIFREYPYLYDGSLDYEKKYMHAYTRDPKALISVAFDQEKVVGISTGIPMSSDSMIVTDIQQKLSALGLNVKHYYYYGEAIVVPEYRGKSLVRKLLGAQEVKVRNWGYQFIGFLTVKRAPNHPLRPRDYRMPDGLWMHLGFHKSPNFTINFSWKTFIDHDARAVETRHTMEFWEKKLL